MSHRGRAIVQSLFMPQPHRHRRLPRAVFPRRLPTAILLLAAFMAATAWAQEPRRGRIQKTPIMAPDDAGGAGATPLAPATLPGGGLVPREVVVFANFNAGGSVELARHYMDVRGIPSDQLLVTGMPVGDEISRRDYEQLVAQPLKKFLIDKKLDQARCVVLMRGVPLRVLAPPATPEVDMMTVMLRDERQSRLETVLKALDRLNGLGGQGATAKTAPPLSADRPAAEQLRKLRVTMMAAFGQAQVAITRMQDAGKRRETAQACRELWARVFGDQATPTGWFDAPAAAATQREGRRQGLARVRGLLAAGDMDARRLRDLLDRLAREDGAVGVLAYADAIEKRVRPDGSWVASVDSELATAFWPPFSPMGHVANPLQLDYHGDPPARTLMTCRLDGPSDQIVRRMIDESAEIERTGLKGVIYIDSRGTGGPDNAYTQYDLQLNRLARLIREHSKVTVVLDTRPELFQPGQCPKAALYVGWYSLGHYVDAFKFVRGAVGFHVASNEAISLNDKNGTNTAWCAQLLEHGCVATLGPVSEPFLTAFPNPATFYGLLMTGKYTLVEAYYQTIPHVSWMMTLIGDPLYNPYKKRPALNDQTVIDEVIP
jgi:uncharacterized protein (TIGR03790 family)